jgi:hypothetical protein
MRLVPWFTLVAAVLVAVSPIGQDVYHSSFVSGEAISNSIGQFLLTVMLAIAAVCAAVEIGVRYWLRRRRVTPASARAP